jgi:hypothetical protein
VIAVNERQVQRVLDDYRQYYNRTRTHLALKEDAPDGRIVASSPVGRVVSMSEWRIASPTDRVAARIGRMRFQEGQDKRRFYASRIRRLAPRRFRDRRLAVTRLGGHAEDTRCEPLRP